MAAAAAALAAALTAGSSAGGSNGNNTGGSTRGYITYHALCPKRPEKSLFVLFYCF
jgi:hypothetical protein